MMAATRGGGALLKKKRPSLLKRNREEAARKRKRQPSVAGQNTAAQARLTKLGPILALLFMLFLTVGAGLAYAGAARPQAAPVIQQADVDTSGSRPSEAFAANLVGAWLSATADDTRTLEAYMPEAAESVDAQDPVEYRDLTVVSSENTEQGAISVIVSATVKDTEQVEDEEIEIWRPQYFQVAIGESDGLLAGLSLPAPVQQPGPAPMPQLGYPTEVEDEEITDTVQGFLSAYATGEGDVTRFTSPDSELTAISNPPFDSVNVGAVFSSGANPAQSPDTGQQTSVLVNATVQTSAGERAAQYALTLTSRDGRWEVHGIDPAPLTATQ